MSQAQDKLIGSVPSRIVDVARLVVTPYEGRVAEYNVATWLQLPGLANLPVSLLVSYRDGDKRREVNVDHGKVNAQGKILLSGIARMPVRQKVEDMQVRLRSAVPAQSLVVEEFFVQAVEQASSESRQALA
ncbi:MULTISPECIES: hypothetical protein [Pseudomonas]|jgi:hypothetical protein|uniref:Uncharacterized protein n=2 Tax=Ectopseudomonas TaxID=3236654 RepID=A0A653B025_ECTOL|nr:MULTISPECIES: hypothetical protein [Pseudomonas]TNF19095.1 MAG: hypothetical protein EP327_01710 [Pseudomonadales bacterium]CAE6940729.1 conserved protein of unknown function [Pseudomonas oleovorans]QFT23091.1 hypothetical protein FIV02_16090 [Pseudomonas sp. THAF187a]QFT43278.1 hypothetical protein FIU98_16070 [Pseudomonas sp. THAF42]WFC63320.1 hypothetical protein EWH21_16910 [Pseudomonas sp. REST10]|tara:strand:+ start:31885 stop:32277 length:393 start_codon:yes stop_codon:yes gene_type:complete